MNQREGTLDLMIESQLEKLREKFPSISESHSKTMSADQLLNLLAIYFIRRRSNQRRYRAQNQSASGTARQRG